MATLSNRLRRWLRADHPFVFSMLGERAWFRRWYGGHWERWYIDHPVCGDVWFYLDHNRGIRPALARGTPTCEDHSRRIFCDWCAGGGETQAEVLAVAPTGHAQICALCVYRIVVAAARGESAVEWVQTREADESLRRLGAGDDL